MPKEANQRDNHPKKHPPTNQRMALYTVDMLPPADSREPAPFDRKAGLKVAGEMESPDAAKARVTQRGSENH